MNSCEEGGQEGAEVLLESIVATERDTIHLTPPTVRNSEPRQSLSADSRSSKVEAEKKKHVAAKSKQPSLSTSPETVEQPSSALRFVESQLPTIQCRICRRNIQTTKENYYEYSCSSKKNPDQAVCELPVHKKCLEETYKNKNPSFKKHQQWKGAVCITDGCEFDLRKVMVVKTDGQRELLIKREDVNKMKEEAIKVKEKTKAEKKEEKKKNKTLHETKEPSGKQFPPPSEEEVEKPPEGDAKKIRTTSDGERAQALRMPFLEEKDLVPLKRELETDSSILKYTEKIEQKSKKNREKKIKPIISYPTPQIQPADEKPSVVFGCNSSEEVQSLGYPPIDSHEALGYIIDITDKGERILGTLMERLAPSMASAKAKPFNRLMDAFIKLGIETAILSQEEVNFLVALIKSKDREKIRLFTDGLKFFDVSFIEKEPVYTKKSVTSTTSSISGFSYRPRKNDSISAGSNLGERSLSIDGSEFDDLCSIDDKDRAFFSSSSSYAFSSKETTSSNMDLTRAKTLFSPVPPHVTLDFEERLSSTATNSSDNLKKSAIGKMEKEMEKLTEQGLKEIEIYRQNLSEQRVKDNKTFMQRLREVQLENERLLDNEKVLLKKLEEQQQVAEKAQMKLKEYEWQRDLRLTRGTLYHLGVILHTLDVYGNEIGDLSVLSSYFNRLNCQYKLIEEILLLNLRLLEKGESCFEPVPRPEKMTPMHMKAFQLAVDAKKAKEAESSSEKELKVHFDHIEKNLKKHARDANLPPPTSDNIEAEFFCVVDKFKREKRPFKVVEALKLVAARLGIPTDLNSKDCSICLEPYSTKRAEMRFCDKGEGCGNGFHLACIRPWLEKERNCPLCRKTFLLHDDFPEP